LVPGGKRVSGNLQEKIEFRHKEAECHHRDCRPHPCEKCPLIRGVVGEMTNHLSGQAYYVEPFLPSTGARREVE
jgi:hypothetical protein